VQSSNHIVTTNKPTSSFLQVECPSYRPTVSEDWMEKISHSTNLLTPAYLGIFHPCLWSLKVTLRQGWQASHQPSDASSRCQCYYLITTTSGSCLSGLLTSSKLLQVRLGLWKSHKEKPDARCSSWQLTNSVKAHKK